MKWILSVILFSILLFSGCLSNETEPTVKEAGIQIISINSSNLIHSLDGDEYLIDITIKNVGDIPINQTSICPFYHYSEGLSMWRWFQIWNSDWDVINPGEIKNLQVAHSIYEDFGNPWPGHSPCADSTPGLGRSMILVYSSGHNCGDIRNLNDVILDSESFDIQCDIDVCGDEVCSTTETCETCHNDCGECEWENIFLFLQGQFGDVSVAMLKDEGLFNYYNAYEGGKVKIDFKCVDEIRYELIGSEEDVNCLEGIPRTVIKSGIVTNDIIYYTPSDSKYGSLCLSLNVVGEPDDKTDCVIRADELKN